MSSHQWEKAIKTYEMVLKKDPAKLQARYNIALALDAMGRTQDAVNEWKSYLKMEDTGIWAFKAVRQLNRRNDFSYRICQWGKKRVIIGPMDPFSIQTMHPGSIEKLGYMLSTSSAEDLYIIVHVDQNQKLAKEKALALKQTLLRAHPYIDPLRIKTSWFGEKEAVHINGRSTSLKRSVRFIGIKQEMLNKGVST